MISVIRKKLQLPCRQPQFRSWKAANTSSLSYADRMSGKENQRPINGDKQNETPPIGNTREMGAETAEQQIRHFNQQREEHQYYQPSTSDVTHARTEGTVLLNSDKSTPKTNSLKATRHPPEIYNGSEPSQRPIPGGLPWGSLATPMNLQGVGQ